MTQIPPRRSLDLTGPLLLGGVPNLPENFPVSHKDFIGCMRDLHIDGRQVDMAAFVANNGTTAGKLRTPTALPMACLHHRGGVWSSSISSQLSDSLASSL